MCSQYDTKDWDRAAPKKNVLICFAKDELLNTPAYINYKNNSNASFAVGSKGKQMQDYINSLLSNLSDIEENSSRLRDQADKFFKNELKEAWESSEIDVINVVWIKHLEANEYIHQIIGNQDFVDCNPLNKDREDTEAHNVCSVSLFDRVIHIENRKRWAITVVMNLDSPLPWE